MGCWQLKGRDDVTIVTIVTAVIVVNAGKAVNT